MFLKNIFRKFSVKKYYRFTVELENTEKCCFKGPLLILPWRSNHCYIWYISFQIFILQHTGEEEDLVFKTKTGILPYVLFYILLIVFLGGGFFFGNWTNINWASALCQELCWLLGIEQWGKKKKAWFLSRWVCSAIGKIIFSVTNIHKCVIITQEKVLCKHVVKKIPSKHLLFASPGSSLPASWNPSLGLGTQHTHNA